MAKKLSALERILIKIANDFENNFMRDKTIESVLLFDELRTLSYSEDFFIRFIDKTNNLAQPKRNEFAVKLFTQSMQNLEKDLQVKVIDGLKEMKTRINSKPFIEFIEALSSKNENMLVTK